MKQREGFLAQAKPDTNGLAIGYGMHTYQGKPVTEGMTITEDAAHQDMMKQIADIFAPSFTSILRVPINQNQFDALLSVAWNSPSAAKALAQKLNRGVQLTLQDFLVSATVQGKPHPSLLKRRAEEFTQFNSGS